ncbi:hypothetical protein AQI94_19235 [Streptomyces pseudovenezuelae]|uniref:Proline rich protein membrane protein n=1 Tax=Streptomyces pseudovenezuelae TaxID=67350 RepID=A0A101N5J9_9ACTN|nr:hypothetical protein AQI94_19235 [Streptomyces pseudovenezuelae]
MRKVWWWRWRRNPLRRRSDRLEAWLVLVTWTLALLGGLLAGVEAGAAMAGDLAARRAALHTVSAVLVEKADRTGTVTADGTAETVRAKVRWKAPDGSPHTGLARVAPGSAAGTSVTVWNDRDGDLVRAPLNMAEARLQSVLTGVLVAAAAGAVVCGGGHWARLRLDRRRLRDWEAEWARVAPSGGRT